MRPLRVSLLVVPGSELLDISGPWEVLAHANEVLGRRAYELELAGPGGRRVATRHGVIMDGVRSLPRDKLPDIAIVAGGSPKATLPPAERRLVAWLRRNHRRISTVVSICTGAFLLGEAGVLDGRRATTHWLFLDDLRARFPAARVVDEGIFVTDGSIWTSAGITTGIDLALALVHQHHGHEVAMAVAKKLVLFLRRSGSQAQFSPALRRQDAVPDELGELMSFVLERIDAPLPAERIAAAMGMSLRTLSRWCRDRLGESPAELVRRLRLDEARRLLEESTLPLKSIAARTGLGDPSTMWRIFTQRLGVTPAEYRARFAAR